VTFVALSRIVASAEHTDRDVQFAWSGPEHVRRSTVNSSEAWELIREVRCRYVMPAFVRAEDTLPSEWRLARLGFTLQLPAETTLGWLRFTAQILRAESGGIQTPTRITAWFPRHIATDATFGGRLAVANDSITAVPIQESVAGKSAFHFVPLVCGYQVEPTRVIWDVTPAQQNGYVGTQTLFLVSTVAEQAPLYARVTLLLRLNHPIYGVMSLVSPRETQRLR
jgi:hypothetical protein